VVGLRFLDRENERDRLNRALGAKQGTFCCLYGRRRCGKSRLIRETLPAKNVVYYVADMRESTLQRGAVAMAIAECLPGFDDVMYPDWDALLARWWQEAPNGAVLALDEFPYLVQGAPELPSLLQKLLDAHARRPVHLVLSGSSQRMMQGLVLDESEPLYGRAREIIKVEPLGAAWLTKALRTADWRGVLDAFAVWGGVPRYWELARDHKSFREALSALVLDPMGVLHREPARLLADDMRDTVQASSILTLVGQGCHRLSEIAGRLGKPSTSLTRPVHRLLELGLLDREVPFGENPKSSKTSLYSVADPFLTFWFRFVEPNRSRLGAGAIQQVAASVRREYPRHVGAIWERLVRAAVPRSNLGERVWKPASRWWGAGLDRRPLEIDVVAESADGKALLVGETKLSVSTRDVARILRELDDKLSRLPFAASYDETVRMVFAGTCSAACPRGEDIVTAEDIVPLLT